MTADAARLPEEEQRTALLRRAHRARTAAREAIERGVGEDQRELELGDGVPEHEEVDRSPRGDRREELAEAPAVGRARVEAIEDHLPDRVVAVAARVGWGH